MNIFFLYIASFIDKSLSFEGRSEVYIMNVQYSDIVNKVLVDHRDDIWVREEMKMLQTDIK